MLQNVNNMFFSYNIGTTYEITVKHSVAGGARSRAIIMEMSLMMLKTVFDDRLEKLFTASVCKKYGLYSAIRRVSRLVVLHYLVQLYCYQWTIRYLASRKIIYAHVQKTKEAICMNFSESITLFDAYTHLFKIRSLSLAVYLNINDT